MKDQVAALVDLMSFLFILAVVLFVISAPFKPRKQQQTSEIVSIQFSVFKTDKLDRWAILDHDASASGDDDILFSFFLGAGTDSVRRFENAVSQYSARMYEGRALIVGGAPIAPISSATFAVTAVHRIDLIGATLSGVSVVRFFGTVELLI